MTKQKLKGVEALVKGILEQDERARSCDNYLYLRVCEYISHEVGHFLWQFEVPYFLLNMKELGYPPFETVRRSRQKIQRKFPELRANKEVTDQREDNEKIYREFIKEEVI